MGCLYQLFICITENYFNSTEMVFIQIYFIMSIPKEPRQLMVNLMYIVLTAMLALNVSAEIVNAFFIMDQSIQDSNAIVQNTNQKLLVSLETQADAYTQYADLYAQAQEAQKIAKSFYAYIDELRELMIEESGGIDELTNLPKGKLNKDVTTRLFLNEGRGDELKERILTTKNAFLELIENEEDQSFMESKIPLNVMTVSENSDDKTWSQITFDHMPVAAILPTLSKLQNDAKIAETALLNYFLEQTNSSVKPDAFVPVVAADKSYVIKGEPYTAELFLGAYSTTAENLFVKVDGKRVPVRNGKAIFKSTPNRVGEYEHEVVIGMTDPIDGSVKTFKKRFGYEAGERSVAISADKMNVLYVGVDNPISISAAGVPTEQIKVNASGTKLNKISNGKYTTKPTKTGRATITVSGGDLSPTSQEYRIKRIPNPTMKLGDKSSGSMKAGTFKVYDKITPVLENFDFEARCTVKGFELTRQPKNKDVIYETNLGGKYNGATKRIVNQAKAGDIFYFSNIRVQCPGDTHSRKMDEMVFRIK